MKSILMLMIVGIAFFVGYARAQSSNVTDSPLPTCPPQPTCQPVEECTCPPVTECPTTESTRTRGHDRTNGRTSRTNHTDTGRTRTDGTGGRTNRKRTGTGRPTNKTRPRRDCTPKLPPGCEDFTGKTQSPLPPPDIIISLLHQIILNSM